MYLTILKTNNHDLNQKVQTVFYGESIGSCDNHLLSFRGQGMKEKYGTTSPSLVEKYETGQIDVHDLIERVVENQIALNAKKHELEQIL